MQLIAPVPARPAWSVDLHSREARSLGHLGQAPAMGRLNGWQSDQTGGGQPPAGQPPAGQPSAGQPPAGQPPAGQPPAGQPPAGTDSTRASDTAPASSA